MQEEKEREEEKERDKKRKKERGRKRAGGRESEREEEKESEEEKVRERGRVTQKWNENFLRFYWKLRSFSERWIMKGAITWPLYMKILVNRRFAFKGSTKK